MDYRTLPLTDNTRATTCSPEKGKYGLWKQTYTICLPGHVMLHRSILPLGASLMEKDVNNLRCNRR